MFAIIFTLLWYIFLLLVLLVSAVFLFVMVRLLRTNDFPNRRQMCTNKVKLAGKTAVVTGSNTGIGFETAKGLASRGARVIMVCRNLQKAEAAKSRIIAETGNDNVVTMQCDFADLESVQQFCKNFLAQESALHILVNNAGAGIPNEKTKQNFHFTFGVNYVGPFLLTYLLLDLMKKSAPSRIVNVSSVSHYGAREMGLLIEENGIKLPQLESYDCSKLASVLHAKELTRKLKGVDVTACSLHPGFIYDGIPLNRKQSDEKTTWMSYILRMVKFTSITAEQGAQTSIFCAVDESVASGNYYDNCKVKEPNKLAHDADLARRLWNATLEAVNEYTKVD